MEEARIKLLQSMPIFGGIQTKTLEFLLRFCRTVSVSTDDFFFREKDPGGSMFILESGQAVVVKNWHGQEHVLQIMKTGDCFGEMSVMDLGARSACVRASEDCTAIQISAADLYKVYAHDLKQFAMIQMNMGREVCRRLRAADERWFSARMGLPESGGKDGVASD
jgi:CRP/FNR family transcriptional regulator, cyclic AMP receptor protein